MLCALRTAVLLLPLQEPAPEPPAPTPPAAPPAAAESRPPAFAPGARALFERLCAHLQPEAATSARPNSFAIDVQMITRDGVHRNEDAASLAFLAPGFVRLRLRSGREQGLGPDGYWLREKAEVVPLVGRDYAEDRAQIDEIGVLAANLAALLRPRGLRLDGLRELNGPDAILPTPAIAATPLVWLEIASRDFRLPPPRAAAGGAAAPPDGPHRAALGLDPATARPRCAIVHPPASNPEAGAPVALLFDQPKLVDGRQLPQVLLVHRALAGPTEAGAKVGSGAAPLSFEPRAHLELYLLEGSRLDVALEPKDFAAQRR